MLVGCLAGATAVLFLDGVLCGGLILWGGTAGCS